MGRSSVIVPIVGLLAILGMVPGFATSDAAKNVDSWKIVDLSPTSDGRTFVFLSRWAETVPGRGLANIAFLRINCIDRKTSLTAWFPTQWPNGANSRRVSYRIGDQEPVRAIWHGAGEFEAVSPSGQDSISLVKQLATARSFVFWAGHGPESNVSEIRLDGLSKHLPKYREACDW